MIGLDYIKYIYIDAPLIAQVALVFAAIFSYAAVLSFSLSLFSRVDQLAYHRRKKRLITIYQRRLTELLFEENGEADDKKLAAIKEKYLTENESRDIMTEILLEQQRNFSGELNERIKYFYRKLDLVSLSIEKINNRHWYKIAIGIRELGLLGESNLTKLIEPFANHQYLIIRREAQLALVRLNGVSGLSFLKHLKYRLSEWQQLNLFETLAKLPNLEKPKLTSYLEHDNPSVICFALKLVGFFKIMEDAEKVVILLLHNDREVRFNAVQAIARLEYFQFGDELLKLYSSQPIDIRVEILKAFADIGMPTLLDFLVVEFNSTQFEISLHAAKAIKAIDSNFLLQINAANIDDEYQHQEIKMQLTHNI